MAKRKVLDTKGVIRRRESKQTDNTMAKRKVLDTKGVIRSRELKKTDNTMAKRKVCRYQRGNQKP